MFAKLLSSHYTIKEFAAITVLHHNMHVSVIDVALVKFDDIRVVYLLKNGKFFF